MGREEGGRETCGSLMHFAWEGQEAASNLSQVLPHLFHGQELCLQIHSQTVTSWLMQTPTYKCRVWFTLCTLKLAPYSGNKSSLHRENIFLPLQVGHALILVTRLTAWRCGWPIQVAQKSLQKAINENNLKCIFRGMQRVSSSHLWYGGGDASSNACGAPCIRVSGHWRIAIHSLIRPDTVLSG